jgi:hypothetical protein
VRATWNCSRPNASLVSVPHTDDHRVSSSIARPTTPNTPFAACEYDLAITRLGAGPNIDPLVVLRGTAAMLVRPDGVPTAAAQGELAIQTRVRVLQDDPTVDRFETIRSKAPVQAQKRSDSHVEATQRRGR